MFERIFAIQDAVKATTALIDKDIQTLTAEEWKICGEMCNILKPFEQVTHQISGEKHVTGSQIIYLTTGLINVTQKLIKKPFHKTSIDVAMQLQSGLLTRFENIESNTIVGVCSLLDPRYKIYDFSSPQAQHSIKERVKKMATHEYNMERRHMPATNENESSSTN